VEDTGKRKVQLAAVQQFAEGASTTYQGSPGGFVSSKISQVLDITVGSALQDKGMQDRIHVASRVIVVKTTWIKRQRSLEGAVRRVLEGTGEEK